MISQVLATAVAIVGATLHTGDGPAQEQTSILIENEKIVAVGRNLAIPADAQVIDASGAVITPGLIDAASRLGLAEINQVTTSVEGTGGPDGDPLRAALRVVDTFNPASQPIEGARQGGLTNVLAIPVDGIVSGQSAWVELGDSAVVTESPVALHVKLGASGGTRGSRARRFLILRRALEDAELYRSDLSAYRKANLRDLSPSAADLKVLARALAGTLPVVFDVDRAADIRTTLRLASEYGLWAVLQGVAEGWIVADEIAAAKVPVLLDPFENLPGDFDSLESRADNALLLHRAGVTVAFTLQGEAHRAARLRQAAGIAVANGFPYDEAIAAITRVPAEIFGSPEIGRLRVGGRANLVIWTGDPLELGSFARQVFVGGREVDLRSRQDALTERYNTKPDGSPNTALNPGSRDATWKPQR